MKKIVIIGNGIAGVTFARNIRKKSNDEITIISSESKYFFSRTALMYLYMGHMKFSDIKPYEDFFWEKNRINLVEDYVIEIRGESKELNLRSGKSLDFDLLIIATGSKWSKHPWAGTELEGVSGMVSLDDLNDIEKHSINLHQAVVVGGGLIGTEMVEMFHSRKIPVTFLVREDRYWKSVLPVEESGMIQSEMEMHKVDLRLGKELKEILGDNNQHVCAISTKNGEEIKCGFVGIAAGVEPNISFLESSGIHTGKGVLVNEYFETNIPDIYAIGDCAEFLVPVPGRSKIEQTWYTGKMQGESLALSLTEKKTPYSPRPWFNSAKFFDLEWQVYGNIPAELSEGTESLFWKNFSGKKALRINFNISDRSVTGFSTLGIRLRHLVCEKWLLDKTSIEKVIEEFAAANFDPEFYRFYEKELAAIFESMSGKKIIPKKANSFYSLIFKKSS